jgi:hypothetical protein
LARGFRQREEPELTRALHDEAWLTSQRQMFAAVQAAEAAPRILAQLRGLMAASPLHEAPSDSDSSLIDV